VIPVPITDPHHNSATDSPHQHYVGKTLVFAWQALTIKQSQIMATARQSKKFFAIAGNSIVEKKGLIFMSMTTPDGESIEVNCSSTLWYGVKAGHKYANGTTAAKDTVGYEKFVPSTDDKISYVCVNCTEAIAGVTSTMIGGVETVDTNSGFTVVSINKVPSITFETAAKKIADAHRDNQFQDLMKTAIEAVSNQGGTGADMAALLAGALQRR